MSTLAVLALFAFSACTSRKLPLPTLEDYSDRVSVWAERFLDDWEAGAKGESFYSAGFRWSGPLPGDGLQEVPARRPLSIRVYRVGGASASSPGTADAAALRRRLGEIRSRFESLGRTENILFEFFRRGEKREVILGMLLTGKDREGTLRQEGGRVRAILVPASPGAAGEWRLESGSLLEWTSARASEQVVPWFSVRDEDVEFFGAILWSGSWRLRLRRQ